MLLLEKARKSKNNEDFSVKIGNGAQFSGDTAIGKGAKVVKNFKAMLICVGFFLQKPIN